MAQKDFDATKSMQIAAKIVVSGQGVYRHPRFEVKR
jgi:hypothetical protein